LLCDCLSPRLRGESGHYILTPLILINPRNVDNKEVSMLTPTVPGSYPRSPEPPRPSIVNRAIENWQAGNITDKELERAFQRATVEMLVEIIAAGVEVAGDGHLRWDNPADYILRRLAGFDSPPDRLTGKGNVDASDAGLVLRSHATGRVEWRRPILVDDFRFLQERAPVDIRPALTGPFSLARLVEPGFYTRRRADLTMDLAQALNREMQGLAAAGAKYILIEEPLLSDDDPQADEFFSAGSILCDNIDAVIFIAGSGSLAGLAESLERSPFGGLVFDLVHNSHNDDILVSNRYFNGHIVELGLIDGRDKRVESEMEVGMGIMRYAAHYDPDRLWVAPTGPFGLLPRNIAFEKLCNMCRGVEWARKNLARQEIPGLED